MQIWIENVLELIGFKSALSSAFVIILTYFVGYITLPSRLIEIQDEISTTIKFIVGFLVLSIIYTCLGIFQLLKYEYFILIITSYLLILFYKNKYRYCIKKFQIDYIEIAILIPLFLIAIFNSALPPYNWDYISYGLTIPKIHIQNGNTAYLDQYGIFSAYPIYGETLIGVPLLLTSSIFAASLYPISFLFISFQLIYKVFKISESNIKMLLIILFMSIVYTPYNVELVGSGKIDLAQSALVLISIFILLMKYNKNNLYFSILLYSIAIGIKYTSILSFPIYLILYLIYCYENKLNLFNYSIKSLIIFFIINFPWFINNYINLCNPIYPYFIKYIGSCSNIKETVLSVNMMSESMLMHKNMTVSTSEYPLKEFTNRLIDAYGFCNIVVYTSFIALLNIFFKKRNIYIQFGPYLLIANLIMFFFYFFWEFRYFTYILPLLIIFIMISLSINKMKNNIFYYLVCTSLFISVTFQSYNILTNKFDHDQMKRVLNGKTSPKEIKENTDSFWVAEFLNNNQSTGEIAVFNWSVQPFSYLINDFYFIHDFNPNPAIMNLENSLEFKKFLSDKNAQYLIWRDQDDSFLPKVSVGRKFHINLTKFKEELVLNGSITPLITKKETTIYKVNKFIK